MCATQLRDTTAANITHMCVCAGGGWVCTKLKVGKTTADNDTQCSMRSTATTDNTQLCNIHIFLNLQ